MLSPPAAAQPKPTTPYDRAIAAGYKALFLCSGIFVAGRTREQIEAEELRGIYPEYDAIVPTLTDVAIIRAHDTPSVGVAFDDAQTQFRVAMFQGEDKGCHLRPVSDDFSKYIVVVSCRPYPCRHGEVRTRRIPETSISKLAQRSIPNLSSTADRAFDSATFGALSSTSSVLILRSGAVAYERYATGFSRDTTSRTWSVAKSLAGTLVGIAAHQGLLDLAKPPAIPEWRDPKDPRRAVTLDNLLRMASGLHSDTAGNRTDDIYFGGTAVTEQAPFWPLIAKPGSRFRYANNDTLLAIRALRSVLGEERYRDFPRTALFDRIGMTRTVAETDWQGNFILSSQVWSTARDLARFGLLYLNDGVWNGERILPEGWVKYVTTPSGPQPESGPRYGATFWLFGPEQGLPAGSYAAQGNRGQYAMIVPSKRLVVVRQGLDAHGVRFDIARFTADVIKALE